MSIFTPMVLLSRNRILAAALDLVLSVLAWVWLVGGVQWQGREILRHGADLRRTALLIAVLAASALPALWDQSLWLRATAWVWQALKTRRGRWFALVFGFVLASSVAVLQALALRVPMYDVGLFHQILWGLAHGHGFLSTISGAGNFLLDHFSPSLVLLVPTFWLTGSSPLTLQIIQPALLFGGAAAWVWLAERLSGADSQFRSLIAAATTLFALSFDSLWGNLHWGFHENAVAFAALSWAFALIFSEGQSFLKKLMILVLFLVAAGSKEILLLDVAMALGVWAALRFRANRSTSLKLLFIAVVLVITFVWFERMPHPADKNYFDRYYAYLGRDLGTFFRTLLLSPWAIVQNVGAGELARYFLTVFLPWLFLPLYALIKSRRDALWLLALLPSLVSAALSTYSPLRGRDFHYVLELWPVLAALTLVILAKLRSRRLVLIWSLLALLSMDHDPWGGLREYWVGAREQAPARALLSSFPGDARLSADELAGTWVAGREWVTRWPASYGDHCPDHVILRGNAEVTSGKMRCAFNPLPKAVAGDWHVFELERK